MLIPRWLYHTLKSKERLLELEEAILQVTLGEKTFPNCMIGESETAVNPLGAFDRLDRSVRVAQVPPFPGAR